MDAGGGRSTGDARPPRVEAAADQAGTVCFAATVSKTRCMKRPT
jgi:hypothetical protein